jgi:UDP-N-acetylglucosamine 2-epimerase (non-hydrolysing)
MRPAAHTPWKCSVAVLFGTRPELIKLAPVIGLLRRDERFALTTVCTSQHREMIVDLLRLFDVRPDHDLGVIRPDQSLTDISVRTLHGLERVLAGTRQDLLLIQGDTTSAFAGALAAVYQRIAVGHVEAGLRSFDRAHPFPEETNRRLISVLTDLHFAPLPRNCDNLLREGIPPGSIYVTGNTAIDALRAVQRPGAATLDQHLPPQALAGRRLVLVTAHRRESFGESLAQFCGAIRQLVAGHPDVAVLYPVHMNLRVRETVTPLLGGCERIHLVEPLPYDIFVQAMSRSHMIITDSGGVQEEAPALGKPVLVFRKVTERLEGLEASGVRLVGLDPGRLVDEATRLLSDKRAYAAMARPRDIYGDGRAAERIVGAILHHFGRGERPAPFATATPG